MSEHHKPLSAAESTAVILELIRHWQWFAYVPEEGRQWLAQRASIRHVAKGRQLYAAGDPATHVYGTVRGSFRIYLSTPKGDEIALEEVISGRWFPHHVPQEPPTYLAHCVCQQDADVVAIPQTVINELAERWPGYFRGLYLDLTARLPYISARIEMLSLHHLDVRLAVYLLRTAQWRGQKQADTTLLLTGIGSQSEIASRVGSTRQRVNQLLKTWTDHGWIELHKEGLRILDIDALMDEARKSDFDLDAHLAGWHGGSLEQIRAAVAPPQR